MLTKRIIPCLDVANGYVVKGVQFKSVQAVADPVELGAYYALQGADELVYYDITASVTSTDLTTALIERIAEKIAIPFTVGGGIHNLNDFYRVLAAGADKVSINSAALRTPDLINEAAKRFGSQCVVVSMDIGLASNGHYEIFTGGGQIATGLCPFVWAKQAVSLGAGELVLNAIHADGMKSGFDINLTRLISESVNVPIVASGGAGQYQDFFDVLTEGKADAALAASTFHSKQLMIPTLKRQLESAGLSIRI